MTSKSKIKGNSWERELCKFLKEELEGNFERVPNSGAFVGGKNFHRKVNMTDTQLKLTKGDIITPDHLSKLVIECKFYSEFKFHGLISETLPMLDNWIQQGLDVVEENDFWIVAFKINRRGSFICYDAKHEFELKNHSVYYYTNSDNIILKTIVTDLETFVKNNKDKIKEICK